MFQSLLFAGCLLVVGLQVLLPVLLYQAYHRNEACRTSLEAVFLGVAAFLFLAALLAATTEDNFLAGVGLFLMLSSLNSLFGVVAIAEKYDRRRTIGLCGFWGLFVLALSVLTYQAVELDASTLARMPSCVAFFGGLAGVFIMVHDRTYNRIRMMQVTTE